MSADALLVAARSGDKTLMAQALSSGVDIDMLLDEVRVCRVHSCVLYRDGRRGL